MRARCGFLVLLLALCVLGCTAKSVEFSREGVPHCPHCKVDVKPHTNFCSACQNEYAWTTTPVPCWRCKGGKVCVVCAGSGSSVETNKCSACAGSGICTVCDAVGLIEAGEAPTDLSTAK